MAQSNLNTGEPIYIRLSMEIPEANVKLLQYAELRPLGGEADPCLVSRYIELGDATTITGYQDENGVVGQVMSPLEHVPHPSTYHAYPDIQHEILEAEAFEELWRQALSSM